MLDPDDKSEERAFRISTFLNDIGKFFLSQTQFSYYAPPERDVEVLSKSSKGGGRRGMLSRHFEGKRQKISCFKNRTITIGVSMGTWWEKNSGKFICFLFCLGAFYSSFYYREGGDIGLFITLVPKVE